MKKYKIQILIQKNSQSCVPLRYPYRNLKFDNSQDFSQKPQQSCMFMNSASVYLSYILLIKSP